MLRKRRRVEWFGVCGVVIGMLCLGFSCGTPVSGAEQGKERVTGDDAGGGHRERGSTQREQAKPDVLVVETKQDNTAPPDRQAPPDRRVVPDTRPDRALPPDRQAPPDRPALPDRDTPPERPTLPEQGTPTADYSKAGPLSTKTQARVTYRLPASGGCGTNFCTVYLDVEVPTSTTSGRQAPYPLAIISNGFLLGANVYKSYAKRLASWGYVVIRWDTNRENPLSNMTHKALGNAIIGLIDWAKAQNNNGVLKGLVKAEQVFVVGHSRGGKASALAAQQDKRIQGFFGIDPVDASPRSGADFPSAVKGMGGLSIPIAVVGAGKGAQGFQACAPAKDNYAKFYTASKSPAWELLIPEAGHMQFLDTQAGCLPCFACAKGRLQDAVVRQITQTAMVVWAEKSMRQVSAQRYTQGVWVQSLSKAGTVASRTK